MDILVIGNGFDLAHGLKTDYGSFLRFLKAVSEYNKITGTDYSEFRQKYSFYINYFSNLFHGGDEEKKKLLVRTANENKWIKHFQSVYAEREQNGKTGWIDFESEISFFIQILDKIKRSVSEQTIFHDRDIIVSDTQSFEYIDSFIGDDEEPSWPGSVCLDDIDKIEDSLLILSSTFSLKNKAFL